MSIFNGIKNIRIKGGYKGTRIEKQFEREIIGILRSKGYYCFHPQDVGLGNKFLDLHIIKDGPQVELGWIEFKQIKGKTFNIKSLRDEQQNILILLKEHGEIWIYSQKENNYIRITYREIVKRKNKNGSIKLFD